MLLKTQITDRAQNCMNATQRDAFHKLSQPGDFDTPMSAKAWMESDTLMVTLYFEGGRNTILGIEPDGSLLVREPLPKPSATVANPKVALPKRSCDCAACAARVEAEFDLLVAASLADVEERGDTHASASSRS